MSVVALVLAAGEASRFGSNKLLAPLGGRPVLQHVLDAVAGAALEDVVVVLGREADAVEAAMAWRRERRVRNERPQDGLSSSLRVGLDAAVEVPGADAVLVVLGDQPALRPEVVRAILEAAASPSAASARFVRARYADDPAPNPVLVRRSAWALAAGLDGDRGLGPLLAARPELVAEVPVPGANPDIDTPAELAALALDAAGPGPGNAAASLPGHIPPSGTRPDASNLAEASSFGSPSPAEGHDLLGPVGSGGDVRTAPGRRRPISAEPIGADEPGVAEDDASARLEAVRRVAPGDVPHPPVRDPATSPAGAAAPIPRPASAAESSR